MKKGDIGNEMYVPIKGRLGIYLEDFDLKKQPAHIVEEFNVVGEKRMMSVGEYYMYAMIDVEIIDIEENYKLYFKIMGRDFNKDTIINVFFKKEYIFKINLDQCISEDLIYFHTVDYPRIVINEITMSDELYENIKGKEI
jgi:hypothetical protein